MGTNFLRSQFPSQIPAQKTVSADRRTSLIRITQQREARLSEAPYVLDTENDPDSFCQCLVSEAP